jgi:DNA/RNA-binding protein KIN17
MMRDRYPNVRKKANELYTEFIDDRNHVHMNATQWANLTAFCEHLKSFKNIAVEDR